MQQHGPQHRRLGGGDRRKIVQGRGRDDDAADDVPQEEEAHQAKKQQRQRMIAVGPPPPSAAFDTSTIIEGDDDEEEEEEDEGIMDHHHHFEEDESDPAFLGDLVHVVEGDFPVQVYDDTSSSSIITTTTTTANNKNKTTSTATIVTTTTTPTTTTSTNPIKTIADHHPAVAAGGTTTTTSLLQQRQMTKKRGRTGGAHRHQHLAQIQQDNVTGQLGRLPANQYDCQLIRRIFTTTSSSSSKHQDTALGMKLNIVESGDVVVQHVTALLDGTASPAMHTGKIRRGDVLLMIDGKCLAGGNALNVLNVLKDTSIRSYTLRLAAGEGLRYLSKSTTTGTKCGISSEANHHSNNNNHHHQPGQMVVPRPYDPAGEMLGLFPMVDQLSGMPLLFETNNETHHHPSATVIQQQYNLTNNKSTTTTPQKSNVTKKQQLQTSESTTFSSLAPNMVTSSSSPTANKKSFSDTSLATTTAAVVMNEHISAVLADRRRSDRNYFLSEWLLRRNYGDNNAVWGFLHTHVSSSTVESSNSGSVMETNGRGGGGGGDNRKNNTVVDTPLTLAQRQALGRQAMGGAVSLLAKVTALDHGKDNRSFHSWNTTLSLYSRASTRRQRIFDAASLPLGHNGKSSKSAIGRLVEAKEEDDDDDDDANSGTDVGVAGSTTSSQQQGSGQQLDGDALLLRLAARDEIWRSQVIEFLDNVAREAMTDDDDGQPNHKNDNKPEQQQQQQNGGSGPKNPAAAAVVSQDMNAALSNELGSFLFGENMTKILAKHKTPRALPPEEVTAVLFDLATRLSATVPDEIKAAGSLMISPRIGLTPFEEKQKDDKSEFMLATRFLLDNALPAWLKTFRPLAWEHRRMLWPVDQIRYGSTTTGGGGGQSSMASSISDDDLTLDSTGSQITATAARKRKKKDLREIVEERELNIETRGETCFLTTYYFIHGLLPKIMGKSPSQDSLGTSSSSTEENGAAKDDIVVFLGEFGSYLKMDTCLAYASALKFEAVVDLLLSIAKYDPRHKEMIKQTSKSIGMVLYEPTMLSAVLQLLRSVVHETSKDRRTSIMELCAAAYPDVQAWQVEKTSIAAGGKGPESLYYQYLSLLLHPIDGNELARRDASLIKEWCELSVAEVKKKGVHQAQHHFSNFLSVASKASSDHLAYYRDLGFLLEQAMMIGEDSLVLDLSGEVLDDYILSNQEDSLDAVATNLRSVSLKCLVHADGFYHAQRKLRRVLRLFNKKRFRDSYSVQAELLRWIEHKEKALPAKPLSDSPMTPKLHPDDVLELIQFLAEEAEPLDVLRALSLWCGLATFQPELVPILHRILPKGASSGSELSTALFQIKMARQRLLAGETNNMLLLTSSLPSESRLSDDSDRSAPVSIWKSMAAGSLTIDK